MVMGPRIHSAMRLAASARPGGSALTLRRSAAATAEQFITSAALPCPSACRFSALHTLARRPLVASIPLQTKTFTRSQTVLVQQPKSSPRRILRSIFIYTLLATGSFGFGLYLSLHEYAWLLRIMSLPVPTDAESLTLYQPHDEISTRINETITTHPLATSLRADPSFTESRPHMKIPEVLRPQNLTGSTLLGPGRVTVPPLTFVHAEGKSSTSLFHLGTDVAGHPGIVHGGLLATILDEGLARTCFPALPNKVGMTANLNVDYKRPAIVERYYVLTAETVKVDGRKAWVEGRIASLGEDGTGEPEVVVEAKALFIEPKQAKALTTLYRVT